MMLNLSLENIIRQFSIEFPPLMQELEIQMVNVICLLIREGVSGFYIISTIFRSKKAQVLSMFQRILRLKAIEILNFLNIHSMQSAISLNTTGAL